MPALSIKAIYKDILHFCIGSLIWQDYLVDFVLRGTIWEHFWGVAKLLESC